MSPPSHRLTAALADRLGEILPPPLTIRAEDGGLDLHAGGVHLGVGSGAASILEEDDDRSFGERAETASRALLDAVQDCVARHLAARWPVDGGGGGEMALPGARARADRLHLWYGESEATAVVTLRPIDLAALAGS